MMAVFPAPFGLAWLGFLLYAFLIIVVAWIFLLFSPVLFKYLTVIARILAMPITGWSGKKRRGAISKKSVKKLFKIKKSDPNAIQKNRQDIKVRLE